MKTHSLFKKNFSIVEYLELYRSKSSLFWEDIATNLPLQLFHKMARRVPAYGDFLRKNNINSRGVIMTADLLNIPNLSKSNYFDKYSLSDVCWDGNLEKSITFSTTSGSLGQSYYFPRDYYIDMQNAVAQALFLKNSFQEDCYPALVIITFGMGPWIGGLISYHAYHEAAKVLRYPISIIMPGIDTVQIMKILKNLAPKYRSTILCGYPPFVKDVLDEAMQNGINLSNLKIKATFAAENFSESFRDYVVENTGMANLEYQTMNIYGSAELGAIGMETPLSIIIRRLASKNQALSKALFGISGRLPTLVQFNPLFVNCEEYSGEIFLTGNNCIPFIRYHIGDQGGVIRYNEMLGKLSEFKISIPNKRILSSSPKLPFVYIHERSDFSVSFYGLQIYPEHLRDAFLSRKFQHIISGRFVLESTFDKYQDPILNIHIESNSKKTSFSKTFTNQILNDIIQTIKDKNIEFRELCLRLKDRVLPRLIFHKKNDQQYFDKKIKQSWIIK